MMVHTVLYSPRIHPTYPTVAADLHYEVDLSPFLSKWSKIMHFRPEFDPFTRLGLRAKTGLFPTFPETPSHSKLKSKLKNSGLPQVPRVYYEEKMSHFSIIILPGHLGQP